MIHSVLGTEFSFDKKKRKEKRNNITYNSKLFFSPLDPSCYDYKAFVQPEEEKRGSFVGLSTAWKKTPEVCGMLHIICISAVLCLVLQRAPLRMRWFREGQKKRWVNTAWTWFHLFQLNSRHQLLHIFCLYGGSVLHKQVIRTVACIVCFITYDVESETLLPSEEKAWELLEKK